MPQRAIPFNTADEPSRRPGALERGRMRRRLREQRRMREALLLDLGALVYELQRQSRREPELLQAKAAELSAVDREVRALASALEAGHGVLELVATGVAGSCASCGSLLSTDARYCQACGAPAVPSMPDPADPALAPSRPQQPPAFPGPSRGAGRPSALQRARPDAPGGRDGTRARRNEAPVRPSLASRLERMRELVRRRNDQD